LQARTRLSVARNRIGSGRFGLEPELPRSNADTRGLTRFRDASVHQIAFFFTDNRSAFFGTASECLCDRSVPSPCPKIPARGDRSSDAPRVGPRVSALARGRSRSFTFSTHCAVHRTSALKMKVLTPDTPEPPAGRTARGCTWERRRPSGTGTAHPTTGLPCSG